MLIPGKPDVWYAEAVTRVYAPWLTSTCVGISARQRREVAELIEWARRMACLPPLDSLPTQLPARPPEAKRAPVGRWMPAASASPRGEAPPHRIRVDNAA